MKTDKITWIFFIIILAGISGGVFHILRLNIFIAKPGSLVINSCPAGAIVYLDGQEKGKTPVTLNNLPQAKCTIKLVREGFKIWEEKIKVKKETSIEKTLIPLSPKIIYVIPKPVINKSPESIKIGHLNVTSPPARANIKAKLKLVNGGLLVKSNPQGAIVYLNGEEKGKTPLNIPELQPWHPYQLQLSLNKYYDWNATLFVEPGEEVKVEANLKARQEGFIFVTSIPGASAVYLDDKLIGQTPLREFTLKTGEYTLKLIKEGYLAQTKKITVLPDEGIFVNFELTKEVFETNF
ncbi:MAG: PEGA domain-containing protein [Nitrospirota bacterium]